MIRYVPLVSLIRSHGTVSRLMASVWSEAVKATRQVANVEAKNLLPSEPVEKAAVSLPRHEARLKDEQMDS